MPLLPTTAADVSVRVVGTRYETCNGQPFFRGKVSDSDEGISCIFASDAQLDLLFNSQELHVDATYKTVPRQFLADRTATQYNRLLASSCCPSVRLSVCL